MININKKIANMTYNGVPLNIGVDTTDATATEYDILFGKTAYVNEEKVTGALSGFTGSHAWQQYDEQGEVLTGYATSDNADEYPINDVAVDHQGNSNFYRAISEQEGAYAWGQYEKQPTYYDDVIQLTQLSTTNGATYFDTNYLFGATNLSKLKIKARFSIDNNTANYRVCGASQSGLIAYLGVSGSHTFAYGNGTADVSVGGVYGANAMYTWELDYKNKTYKVWNGDQYVINTTIAPNTPTVNTNFFIGAYHTTTTPASGTGNIHNLNIEYFSFYEDDVLVRNFIPVKTLSGEILLFDTVTKTKCPPIGGSCMTKGAEIINAEPKKIILHSNANEYPDKGYGEDGYYYVKLESVPYKQPTINTYVWEKQDRSNYYDNIIPYINANQANVIGYDNGWFDLKGTTNSSWADANLNFINKIFTKQDRVVVESYMTNYHYFTGCLDVNTYDLPNNKSYTSSGWYTLMYPSMYMTNTSLVEYSGGSSLGTKATYQYGDIIRYVFENGKCDTYINGRWVYTAQNATPEKYYLAFLPYTNATYVKTRLVTNGIKVVDYVTSGNIGDFPVNNYGEDGYYYKLLTPDYTAETDNATAIHTGSNVPTGAFGEDGDIYLVVQEG